MGEKGGGVLHSPFANREREGGGGGCLESTRVWRGGGVCCYEMKVLLTMTVLSLPDAGCACSCQLREGGGGGDGENVSADPPPPAFSS